MSFFLLSTKSLSKKVTCDGDDVESNALFPNPDNFSATHSADNIAQNDNILVQTFWSI